MTTPLSSPGRSLPMAPTSLVPLLQIFSSLPRVVMDSVSTSPFSGVSCLGPWHAFPLTVGTPLLGTSVCTSPSGQLSVPLLLGGFSSSAVMLVDGKGSPVVELDAIGTHLSLAGGVCTRGRGSGVDGGGSDGGPVGCRWWWSSWFHSPLSLNFLPFQWSAPWWTGLSGPPLPFGLPLLLASVLGLGSGC